MDFSDGWRSLWPIATVFAAPNLLSGAFSKPLGPLLFFPSSPPLLLLSSRSLALQIPPPLPPSALVDGVRSFFGRTATAGFLPSAAQDSLVADLLSYPSGCGGDHPIPSNNLHALHCRDGSSMVLFFPTGKNADSIGYVGLSFKGLTPEIRVDRDGDVFMQKKGFKHPCHRILKISVAAAPSSSWSPAADLVSAGKPLTEGFLIATTLYSVNWFRVETRASDSGRERPFLVPLAKQGFKSSVVHACWSPHIPEESVALLESGDLCCFNLNSKRGRMVRVTLGVDPGKWLSCEYGGQPEILIIACSTAVVMVDLRSKKDTEHKILVKIEMLGSYSLAPLLEKNDRILAFCRAGFNDFHISLVTERQLFLFDARQPLFPILTWDHSLEHPSYVAMFKLSELRPSEDEYKWASDSGYTILAGSLWSNEFSLFCYGLKEKGTLSNSLLYAWDLPSCLSLSARPFSSGDSIVREIFYKENVSKSSEWRQRKDVVVGFCVVPSHLLNRQSKSAGFSLIRLTLPGRLEIQRYDSSWNLSGEKPETLELKDSIVSWMSEDDTVFKRYNFFKLFYLYDYIKSNLFNALVMQNSLSNHKETNKVSLSHDIEELISNILKFSNVSISDFVSDASIPTSIFEIASRRVLSCVRADHLPLVFKKYSDLFGNQRDSSFEFLEVPSCLPHNRLLPFFVGKPSIRSEKWSSKASPWEVLVGPVLPLSVLLALQQIDRGINDSPDAIDEQDDDPLTLQCRSILEHVCPEMFVVDIGNCNGWGASQEQQGEKPFFMYEPAEVGNKSTCNGGTSGISTHAIKEELAQTGHMMRNCKLPYKVEKFDTFICGIVEKKCNPDSGHVSSGPQMLDLSPIRLDFEPFNMVFQSAEQKIYKCLKRQFSKWQENYKPYQDFCSSSKIPKLAQ
ncbi:uncharacterized protein LOC103697887 [Phoenix dactylifera]|uniref:Uncharacterized protein LOC103697887 n=1 Tax=Phoenix dactylifera TaxID=42345 RepID=A0A8B7MSU9_PHODC|nr:uncharacterized protein LOC103697887 [Phoenix dactylifera]XP_017696257.2 uncharacterized protein LOC103697887 [Phoenix dactylifera]XP_017696259.2 uncharacterized protein LOC103697887 [Phoenix dactylifera]XP_026657214.2 uncharacterized protein LOC103697887 [Phoenix dactylifera]XP_038973745.1 uncharacterized protein LOC103697887 [Phoenix dactylifera]XP_038973746.1 uncharacterized protein LOC103697887 [Phoenix dactylifera]